MNQLLKQWEAVKSFFKKFWGVFAALGAAVLGAGVLYEIKKSSSKEEDATLNKKEELIEKVENISSTTQQNLEENEKIHENIVKSIEDQYQQQNKSFDEEKKKEAKKLAQDYAENPEELAKKLSELTGFKVVLPEE